LRFGVFAFRKRDSTPGREDPEALNRRSANPIFTTKDAKITKKECQNFVIFVPFVVREFFPD